MRVQFFTICLTVLTVVTTSWVVPSQAENYFLTGQHVRHPDDDNWLLTSLWDEDPVDSIILLRHDPAVSRYKVITTDAGCADPDSSVTLLPADEPSSESDCAIILDSVQTEWKAVDTLSLFGGLEGSKQPQDFGVNANFGSRWAANWGFPLLADHGIGGQIGTSVNYTDNAVQVFERVGASTHRSQYFSTIGVFQQTCSWRWGLAYDLLYQEYYDQFFLGQWRGRVGYATSALNEFGVWFALPQQNASGEFLTVPVRLTPMSQGSAYWQHQFEAGSRVMGWAGVSEGHSEANLLGDFPRTGPQFLFGAEIDVPLNAYFSIFGQANFIGPADTGTVDSFLGVAYHPGGKAYPAARSLFAPFQALANSTMFALDFDR